MMGMSLKAIEREEWMDREETDHTLTFSSAGHESL